MTATVPRAYNLGKLIVRPTLVKPWGTSDSLEVVWPGAAIHPKIPERERALDGPAAEWRDESTMVMATDRVPRIRLCSAAKRFRNRRFACRHMHGRRPGPTRYSASSHTCFFRQTRPPLFLGAGGIQCTILLHQWVPALWISGPAPRLPSPAN
jgi:hypothetical protein